MGRTTKKLSQYVRAMVPEASSRGLDRHDAISGSRGAKLLLVGIRMVPGIGLSLMLLRALQAVAAIDGLLAVVAWLDGLHTAAAFGPRPQSSARSPARSWGDPIVEELAASSLRLSSSLSASLGRLPGERLIDVLGVT
mmetsp:Transcript_46055/g.133454  ORF Transcript_46055/g.133454 Transcript_46055/m.133454 type:complete len:138 (+) Transcript_46055:1488-1901(+)